MVDGWSTVAAEALRLWAFLWYHLQNMVTVKTERDRNKAMAFTTPQYNALLPKLGLYFLVGLVYAVISPLILPFTIVFFAFGYIIYRNQVPTYVFQSSCLSLNWSVLVIFTRRPCFDDILLPIVLGFFLRQRRPMNFLCSVRTKVFLDQNLQQCLFEPTHYSIFFEIIPATKLMKFWREYWYLSALIRLVLVIDFYSWERKGISIKLENFS